MGKGKNKKGDRKPLLDGDTVLEVETSFNGDGDPQPSTSSNGNELTEVGERLTEPDDSDIEANVNLSLKPTEEELALTGETFLKARKDCFLKCRDEKLESSTIQYRDGRIVVYWNFQKETLSDQQKKEFKKKISEDLTKKTLSDLLSNGEYSIEGLTKKSKKRDVKKGKIKTCLALLYKHSNKILTGLSIANLVFVATAVGLSYKNFRLQQEIDDLRPLFSPPIPSDPIPSDYHPVPYCPEVAQQLLNSLRVYGPKMDDCIEGLRKAGITVTEIHPAYDIINMADSTADVEDRLNKTLYEAIIYGQHTHSCQGFTLTGFHGMTSTDPKSEGNMGNALNCVNRLVKNGWNAWPGSLCRTIYQSLNVKNIWGKVKNSAECTEMKVALSDSNECNLLTGIELKCLFEEMEYQEQTTAAAGD